MLALLAPCWLACKPRVSFSMIRAKPVNPYSVLSFRQTSSFELWLRWRYFVRHLLNQGKKDKNSPEIIYPAKLLTRQMVCVLLPRVQEGWGGVGLKGVLGDMRGNASWILYPCYFHYLVQIWPYLGTASVRVFSDCEKMVSENYS